MGLPYITNMTATSSPKKILAMLSGLALTASFAPLQLDWMAWFALVPLLKSLEDGSSSRAFSLGFIAGLIHYLTLLYWIIPTLRNYGYLHFLVSASVLILFCLYLSLYLALFSYLVHRMKDSRFLFLLIPSLWVSLELIRATALTGFPWCLLGYTQFHRLGLIQIADLSGVYGISFLIILSNALIYRLFFARTPTVKRRLGWEALGFTVLLLSTLVYGQFRMEESPDTSTSTRTINVSVIQGNIDQSVKWEPTFQEETILTYRRLTRSASGFKSDLTVWPETAVPFFFQEDQPFSNQIREIASEASSTLIFGSPAYQRGPDGTEYFNRVYLLSSGGRISEYYDKHHLVPFGEYVPLKRFLPFIHRLVQAAGDFTPGKDVKPLGPSHLSSGILVCFEVIFPGLARTHTREGAKVLVNLTNDAWFGKTSAPYQHLSMAVFRAVENRRPLIRAANTGFSALIDPKGKIIERSGLFREQVLTHEVELAPSSMSIYTQYGDLFPFALLAISLIKFFHVLWYSKDVRPKVGPSSRNRKT